VLYNIIFVIFPLMLFLLTERLSFTKTIVNEIGLWWISIGIELFFQKIIVKKLKNRPCSADILRFDTKKFH